MFFELRENYVEAKKYADKLLAIQPSNRQAMSLKSLAEEKVAKDGLIGMMIVGGAAAAVVSFYSSHFSPYDCSCFLLFFLSSHHGYLSKIPILSLLKLA